MNLDRVEKIAEAVLYEGYMLYPYRPSSVKNQQRWNFGVLYPQAESESRVGPPPSGMQTECLMRTSAASRLTVRIRFLQIVQRSIGRLSIPVCEVTNCTQSKVEFVDRLEFGGCIYQQWQEAVEREITFDALKPDSLSGASPAAFSFPEGNSVEYLRDEQGLTGAVIVRDWKRLDGSVEIRSEQCREGIVKLTVRVENCRQLEQVTPHESLECGNREHVLLDALVSAHTILGVVDGEFISLLDYPADVADLVASCVNRGTFPVLAGEGAGTVLSSPIILYDYPQIAPESAGNLFDSTEIDEILSLRILTLTDVEKREMRQSDDRTRAILERTENMPEEQFAKLHGVLRGLTVIEEGAP